LFRRALKHAALTAALFLPTVAGIVTASPAQATTYSTSGPYKNDAYVWAEYQTNDPTYYADMQAVVSLASTASAFNWDSDGNTINNYANGAIQASGGSTTIYLSEFTYPDNSVNASCTGSQGDPVNFRIQVRNATTHAQIGSSSWTPSYSEACNTFYTQQRPLYLNSDPLGNGTGTPLAAGTYELYLAVEGGTADLTGLTSEGGHGSASSNYFENTAIGTFTVVSGAMLGLIDNRSSDGSATTNEGVLTDDANGISTNKSYAVSRIYDQSWQLPSAEVQHQIQAGKLVMWSEKAPTSVVTDTQGGNHNVPQWSNINASTDGGTSGLYAQLEALYGWADGLNGHASQVVYVAVEHEPHGNASDWGSGSCATTSNGTGGTYNGCHGTAAQFVAAFQHVRNALNYLEFNGYPGISKRVLLAYCAVQSNAVKKVTGGVIGSGDTLYPGTDAVDFLAHDVYNWYHYSTSGDGTNFNTTTPWKDPATLFGDANTGIVTLARQQGKLLLMGELGSHPGCPGGGVNDQGCTGTETSGGTGNAKIQSRDDWFQKVADWIRTSDTQHTIIGWGYYHDKPINACPCNTPPKWNWQFTNTANRPGHSGRGHLRLR
jgi:hypothetical protein